MTEEKPIVVDAEEARQGKKGYQVITVLVVSLTLAGIAFVLLMMWFFSRGPWSTFG